MRIALAFLFSLAGSAAAAPQQSSFLMLERVVGSQQLSANSSGVRARFSFSEREYGEDLEAQWQLDADGLPLRYTVSGHDSLKAPVREQFRRSGDKASWESLSGGKGEARYTQPAFYLPEQGPPELTAVLARALLKAPGRRLALLPEGEARLESIGTLGEGADLLTHYRISGLGFSPYSIWLDAQGTALQVSPWISTLPAGREKMRNTLLAAQREADLAWHADLAQRLGQRPAGEVLVRNARLFDPRDGSVSPGSSVLLRGERIVLVAPGADISAPEAQVIDARGRFLMPGLWDNHQHFGGVDGLLDIANGVTSARDLANDDDEILRRVARFDAGTEIGPRVLRAGMMDGSGPYAGPTPRLVDTPEQAIAAVDWYASRGYVQIKTYMSLKPELVALIAARAHALGLRVSGHPPSQMSAEQFVEAGADEIQHFNYLILNLLWPEVRETNRQSERFGKVAARAHEFDPAQPRVRAFIDFLRQRKVVIDPTLGLLEMRFTSDPSQIIPGLETVAPRFPIQARRGSRSSAYVVPRGQEAAYRAAMPAMYKLLKALHDAGVAIVPGTDALAGYLLHHELALYARAGIPAADVLRMATLTSAQVMGVDKDLGVIANGKLADMILIDGDPLQDIAATRRVDLVFKGGRIYVPAQIEAALGISAAADRRSENIAVPAPAG